MRMQVKTSGWLGDEMLLEKLRSAVAVAQDLLPLIPIGTSDPEPFEKLLYQVRTRCFFRRSLRTGHFIRCNALILEVFDAVALMGG